MNSHQKKRRIREALAALAATHSNAVTEIERAIEALSLVLEMHDSWDDVGSLSTNREHRPRADRDTLSVVWRHRRCFLGNTLVFLFFERLAQAPNRYVSHADLLEDVWGGEERMASSIRNVAQRLRDRLKAEGMTTLADAIDGSVKGHYGLKLV